jgi:RNA-directed DNA polymerase
MSERLTRQQLYDRIRETSKDEFILSEMKKLGFWKSNDEAPKPSEQLIHREAELRHELNDLIQKQNRYNDQQAMIADMKKKRMEESKKKQLETKARNQQKRIEKAENWKTQQQQTVVYLGEGVSGGLNNLVADIEKLTRFGLPNFENAFALAQAMKLTLGRLRFLAYSRKVSTVSHYKRFYIAKKSGGKRLISAPMPILKDAQYWILEHILYKISPTDAAHGFVPQRSILSNAQKHIGKDVVVNLDLKDFFPSIDYKRVKGLFVKIGYSEQIATILALICTEPDVELVEIDGKQYYAEKAERKLPQGAPTSPAITNLICYRLDHRFEGIAKKFGFQYSRYADDLTFSATGEGKKSVGQLLWSAKQVIESEGFTIHPDKLEVMRKGVQQKVTGIVVNEKASIDRKELHKFRALIHQIKTNGIANKSWRKGVDLENSMRGYAEFISMVKPEQGSKFKAQLDQIFGVKVKAEKPTNLPPPIIAESPIEKPIEPDRKPNESGKDWWEVI